MRDFRRSASRCRSATANGAWPFMSVRMTTVQTPSATSPARGRCPVTRAPESSQSRGRFSPEACCNKQGRRRTHRRHTMRASDADIIHLSEEHLLRRLTSRGIRANVLVTCRELQLQRVVSHLVEQIPPPVSVSVVTPDLKMPEIASGIWILHDVSLLTLEQQAEVAEWIIGPGAGVRIVSIASEPLWPLVASGRFVEKLYYQLNTIVCEAGPGRSGTAYDKGAAAS